jgi:hypothetical protein
MPKEQNYTESQMKSELDFQYDALWINHRQQNVYAMAGFGVLITFSFFI